MVPDESSRSNLPSEIGFLHELLSSGQLVSGLDLDYPLSLDLFVSAEVAERHGFGSELRQFRIVSNVAVRSGRMLVVMERMVEEGQYLPLVPEVWRRKYLQ